MATAEASHRPHDRHAQPRRRPFASWMKRLTGLKHHNTPDSVSGSQNAASHAFRPRRMLKNNNPYPESGIPIRNLNRRISGSRPTGRASGVTSTSESQDSHSVISYEDATSTRNGRVLSTRSAAGTVATNPGTINSTHSRAGTAVTGVGATSFRDGGPNSTFSSPHQSEESLTTTLTTLQSTAASAMLGPQNPVPAQPVGLNQQIQPNNQPGAGHVHYATYQMATANNLLTDDASVLTLASSSKRRRRHSLDTNASVRALAPSSLFGASRESLPLSFLSSNVDATSNIHAQRPPTVGNLASTERASVYSASGVAPIVNSERNSYYASAKQGHDGASIRSGLLGHGKADSISGSISGIAHSPLASPKETSGHGVNSRRNSDWHENDGQDDVDEDDEEIEEADLSKKSEEVKR